MRSTVLGESFQAIYDELEKHGNPAWAGVEANAGVPGSVVDWETYLAWHYNHGCVLVGVNTGATGEDLPKRLWQSAFGKEAIAAYHKFLTGQPLVEKPISMDHNPQFRIQVKMKRVPRRDSALAPQRQGPLGGGQAHGSAPSRWRTVESSTSWRNSWTKRLRCWARPRKCPTCIVTSETRKHFLLRSTHRGCCRTIGFPHLPQGTCHVPPHDLDPPAHPDCDRLQQSLGSRAQSR